MNKKTIVFFVMLLMYLLSAQHIFSKTWDFCVFPYIGIERSVYEESFYYDELSEHSEQMCSLLEWSEKPSYIIGLESSIRYKHFLFFADVSTKIPQKCGSMKDSDYWENGLKFNYSVNKNHLNSAFNVQTGGSYFFDFKFIQFAPYIKASYSYVSFSAKDGHGWYGSPSHTSDGKLHSWDSSYSHYYPDGKYHLAGVDYQNQTFYFMAGVEVQKILFNFWNTCLGFGIAPFTYSYVKDEHLGKSSNFFTEDYIYNYFRNFQWLYKNNFVLTELCSLSTIIECNLRLLTKGDDYINGYINSQKGGESYKSLRFKVGVSFIF